MNYEKKYYVYSHSLNGNVFYIGQSKLRTLRGGYFRTHHERAYLRRKEKPWLNYIQDKPFDVEVLGYYDTKKESLRAEQKFISQYKNNGHLVNQLVSYPVFQFSLVGEFIKKWDCVYEVSDSLNIDSSSIRNCLSGKRRSSGGYMWSKSETLKVNINSIVQKDFLGNILNVFPDVQSAANFLGKRSTNAIRNCFVGKQKQAYGYLWERNPAFARQNGFSVSRLNKPL
jgi:hypothetical protein